MTRSTAVLVAAFAAVLPAGCTGGSDPAPAAARSLPIIDCVAFAPDGTKLAATFNDSVTVFDSNTGAAGRTFPAPRVVSSLAWSPDGTLLAGGVHDRTVLIWDVAGGQVRHTVQGMKAPVNAIAWAPDGKLLLVAAGDPYPYADKRNNVRSEVRLFDPQAGKEVGALADPGDTVTGVAFSPDGSRAVTVSGFDGKIRLWDMAARKPVGPAVANKEGAGVSAVAYSADGKTIATGGLDNELTLWDAAVKEKARLGGHADRVNAVAFTAIGPVTASDDGSVRVWDVDAKTVRVVLRDKGGRVHTVAASRDGKAVAAGGAGGIVRLWNLSAPDKPPVELSQGAR